VPNNRFMAHLLTVAPGGAFGGTITVPGDKSISHRALLFGALAEGKTEISNFLDSGDTRATAACLRAMGVMIDDGETVIVHGVGLHGLRPPAEVLYTGNSGTTTRLLMGVLAGQSFTVTLAGDESLNRRPMDRVAIPLAQMGASVQGNGTRCLPPVTIHGGKLRGIAYQSPVASAQVKSAILLAGLYAEGETIVTEPQQSRDHTERMLSAFGVQVLAGEQVRNQNGRSSFDEVPYISRPKLPVPVETGVSVKIHGGQTLRGQAVEVPGDISSAAFFLVAGAILPGADVTVCNVGLNPTRAGVLEVLQAMGADIMITNERWAGGEPVADLTVRGSALHGVQIGGMIIPRLIDELPVLAVAATFADGDTEITGARELRVKESDRIETVSAMLRAMGVEVDTREDGMRIHGGCPLHGADIESQQDHRVAMSAAVAALGAGAEVRIHGADTIATSFPTFTSLLRQLGAKVTA